MSWSSGDDRGAGASDPNHGMVARRAAVRQAVIELVRTRRELVGDADILDGYLRDICPSQPAEVAVVVVAARGGVPDEIVHASEGHHAEAMASRLASRLNAESGIDPVLARWAVDTWALALGRGTAASSVRPGDRMAATVAPPAAPSAGGEALRAMVAPVQPSPVPPEPQPPRPSLPPDGRTLAPAPAAPQQTRSRPPRAAPPPPPAPVPPARDRPSRRTAAVAVAAVAVLVAVGVLVAVSGDDGTDTAGSPTAESTVVTPTSAGAPTSSTPPVPFPSNRGPLVAGTYATSSFKPALTLALPAAWEMLTPETPEFFEIVHSEPPFGRVTVMHLTEVFQAGAAIRSSGDIKKPGAVEPVPGDIPGWLAANPNLTVGARTPVRTAGLSGSRFELTVPTGYESTLCAARCVPLWPFKDGIPKEIGQLAPSLRYLVYALDVGDQKVLVIVATAPEDAGQLLAEAEKVVTTMRFTSR